MIPWQKIRKKKTNVVRILEAAGIPCTAYEVPLPKGKVPDGVTAAGLLGKPVEQVFKTLVAQGPKGNTSCMSSPWPRPWI